MQEADTRTPYRHDWKKPWSILSNLLVLLPIASALVIASAATVSAQEGKKSGSGTGSSGTGSSGTGSSGKGSSGTGSTDAGGSAKKPDPNKPKPGSLDEAVKDQMEQLKKENKDAEDSEDDGNHMKKEECKFDDLNDLRKKVNEKSLEDAKKRGINLDSRGGGPNGWNDALEGRFWAGQGALGSYMCSEFSAYLHCMLQELFDCTEEQVQTIQGNNHAIVRVKQDVFRRPPRASDRGYVRVEPQHFATGMWGGAGGDGGVGWGVSVFGKPNPYRAGINNTNYDELQCKSGPGYNEGGGGSGGGFLGNGASSALLSTMLGSMMNRMNGQNPNLGNIPGSSGDIFATPIPASTATPTPVANVGETPVVTPTAVATQTPQATPPVKGSLSAPSVKFGDAMVLGPEGATGSSGNTSVGRRESEGETTGGGQQPAAVSPAPLPTKSPFEI